MLQALLLAPYLFAQVPSYQFGTDENLQVTQSTVSFSTLDPITQSGQLALGPDRLVLWDVGTRPEEILTLGDIQQSGVQDFTLGQVFDQGGTNIDDYTLADFPLLANSTLEDAANATGNDPAFLNNVLIDGNTVQQAIDQGDGKKTLAEKIGIDKPLKDIEKVQDTVIGKLQKWESELIGNIPGLPAVPFARYPAQLANQSLASISLFAEADLILDKAEKGIANTISGSDKEKTKFQTPCPFAQQQACGHIEFGRAFPIPGAMRGKRWINGKHQKVRGGRGILGALFDNKEPTGRLPFGPGSPFKLVLTKTDESTDRASFSAYFQITDLFAGSTGYNIGPFPLYSVTIRPGKGGTVWLGVNPDDFGKIPIGFDPAVVSAPGSPTGAPLGTVFGLPSPTGAKGTGDPNKCSNSSGQPQYIWPAPGPVTSYYNPSRVHPILGTPRPHLGIDIGNGFGTPMIAAEAGRVITTRWWGGFGNMLEIQDACTGNVLRYAHIQKFLVKEGQEVRKGQVVAEMGSTGLSTGPHLHFEISPGGPNGYPVNPLNYL